MAEHTFTIPHTLRLESGETLHRPEVVYHTYGTLSPAKDNVVWICHALTANADAADWWSGLVGPGKFIDPEKYFIVCANILGSCYGTTGPLSINPETAKPYYHTFPLVTVKDMVAAHVLLRQHLGIGRIHLGIAGSLGGHQLLEWLVREPGVFAQAAVIATSARHSPWGIAFNESQRFAIEQDPTWAQSNPAAGLNGLKVARAIAMLSYRSYDTYHLAQLDTSDKIDGYRASSYQRYQGEKLAKRFNAYSYYTLSKAMDSHDISRGLGGEVAEVLQTITTPILAVSITSDLLFPPHEQEFIAKHVPNGTHRSITSIYGHDGFLLEFEALSGLLEEFVTQYQDVPIYEVRGTKYD
jgi:homoserine O-acetyltransferase/O-succinyltransferase